jgi:hypothetical protein
VRVGLWLIQIWLRDHAGSRVEMRICNKFHWADRFLAEEGKVIDFFSVQGFLVFDGFFIDSSVFISFILVLGFTNEL